MPHTTFASIEEVRAHLIGARRLVAWSEDTPSGTVDYPLGDDVMGSLCTAPMATSLPSS